MDSVEVLEPGKTSILTLLVKQILDRNLQDPRRSRGMRNRVMTVHVRSREMQTTLFFEADRVRAEDGAHGRADLEIAGSMPVLLSIALGASPLRAALARRMRVRPMRWRGWIYGLRLMRMMRLGKSATPFGQTARRGLEQGERP